MSETVDTSLGAQLEALLEAASNAHTAPGMIQASYGSTQVQAEIVDVDRLGVVVERLKIHITGGDIEQQASRVAQTVRPAGQPLQAEPSAEWNP